MPFYCRIYIGTPSSLLLVEQVRSLLVLVDGAAKDNCVGVVFVTVRRRCTVVISLCVGVRE